MAVTPDDIIASAEKLLGCPYREWYYGDSIPMWVDDGYTDYLPDRSYFEGHGVECSDLINYALMDNGLSGIGGTGDAWQYLLDQEPFNLYAPGQRAAVAYLPYTAPAIGYQGHIALYWDEHYLIQSVNGYSPFYGVTYDFTDQQTYRQSADYQFTIYAKLPGVEYPS